ncbi:UPF0182 family protein [Streptomyces sp. NRRL F-5123]|uniref:UPF0182 family membrane protein n=1 Tax=Streptomyces sp. NRRL F-5123 TaxID=1463856 RepID=UPI000A7F27E4|nr:UPF0182 family protein [Streptomyces sp. NRRL F-5123]
MVFQMPDRGGAGAAGHSSRPGRHSRTAVALIVVLGVLAVLMTGLVTLSGLWTDLLWYRSVHYSSVFSTMTRTKAALFAGFGLLMALGVGLNMYLAFRMRPPLSAMSSEEQSLDRYRMGLAPYRMWVLAGICGALGVIAGGAAAAQWRSWLLMAHSTPFHTKDPQFHKDVSFYTFQLPCYRFLVGFGFALVVLSLLAAVTVHYLYGGVRFTSPGARVTGAATAHLAILLGLFVSLKAAAYWLDRYALAVRSGGSGRAARGWTGLRYVDANAYLPAKTILCFIAVICALLFFATAWRRTWTLPAVGFGLMVLSAILIGGLYPAVMQKFQVLPHESAKEAPYVQKNLDATRAAYGLADTEVTQYPGVDAAPTAVPAADGSLRKEAGDAASPTVLDPKVVSPAFQKLQRGSSAYEFPSTLDVDRYQDGGTAKDTVVGVRELNSDGIPHGDWTDDHLVYTHGYGVVTADGSATSSDGTPLFGGRDPGTLGPSGDYQQRIYFGEQTRQYAIVGGGTPEMDYADGTRGGGTTTTYQGKGGVSLSNPLTRAAYAISLGEPRILSSGDIGKGSRILYNRTPKERVAAVAPWLTIDGDPYPTVVGGKVLWVVDGYTTSDDYPYASRTHLGDATADSLTDGRRQVLTDQNEVNYIRNSVKATVDAYDGTVTLYQWDEQDPVLKTWMKAFPHTVEPKADIPAGLLPHLRYPQDLFKVQRSMLTTYHVTQAADFGASGQVWDVPDDPAAKAGKAVPPYYLDLRMPEGPSAKTYSLTSTFTPAKGESMSAFMAVDADPTSRDYGTIRLLRISAGAGADGPAAVQSAIDAAGRSAPAADQLKSLGANATVVHGNLLTIPLDRGLLYVEPVYARAPEADYPQLVSVAAVYGDRTSYRPTLDQALDDLLGPAAAKDAAPPGKDPDAALDKALDDAQQAYADRQAAERKGDRAAYAAAQRRLDAALDAARTAEKATATPQAPAGKG